MGCLVLQIRICFINIVLWPLWKLKIKSAEQTKWGRNYGVIGKYISYNRGLVSPFRFLCSRLLRIKTWSLKERSDTKIYNIVTGLGGRIRRGKNTAHGLDQSPSDKRRLVLADMKRKIIWAVKIYTLRCFYCVSSISVLIMKNPLTSLTQSEDDNSVKSCVDIDCGCRLCITVLA